MSIEANKELIRAYCEEITNRKNLATMERYLTADFVDHEAPAGQPDGPDGVRQYMEAIFAALPDFNATIEDMVGEDDKVAVRSVWRGTHLGEYNWLPATGKSITLRGIVIFRIVDGKIAERWATLDELDLMRQLGLLVQPIIPHATASQP